VHLTLQREPSYDSRVQKAGKPMSTIAVKLLEVLIRAGCIHSKTQSVYVASEQSLKVITRMRVSCQRRPAMSGAGCGS
jgi:hypothetical protein